MKKILIALALLGVSAAQAQQAGQGLFVPVPYGTSGRAVPYLDGANTFSGSTTFSSNLIVNNSSFLQTDVSLGGAGIGTAAFNLNYEGSSGNGGGFRQFWKKAGAAKWQQGFQNTIQGSGTSDDLTFYSQAGSAYSLTLKAADGGVVVNPTTISNSNTTGALTVAGGLGVAGDINWAGAAWSTWTPTLSTASGTGATFGTPIARYKQFGKAVSFSINITITAVGTGAFVTFTAPISTATMLNTVVCWNGGNGFTYIAQVAGTSNLFTIRRYDNAGTIATTDSYTCTGTYEAN